MEKLEKDALLMIYKSIKHRVDFEFDVYENAVKDWNILPLVENSKVIGGVLIKDNEIHVGYGIKPKSTILPYIKRILNETINQYGYVVTSVVSQNEAGLRFCKRLGFTRIGEENGTIKLRCDRSNYK
jgi:RimJ/RimL family protein N-acetyltransferase